MKKKLSLGLFLGFLIVLVGIVAYKIDGKAGSDAHVEDSFQGSEYAFEDLKSIKAGSVFKNDLYFLGDKRIFNHYKGWRFLYGRYSFVENELDPPWSTFIERHKEKAIDLPRFSEVNLGANGVFNAPY